MGRCIICGTSVDGRVCDTHEEDVAFEFRGDQPDQLVADRYYRGTVDGYADFGVFVDVGDRVTGLLHQSELDQRLESLDWEPGEEVYVQVLRVRDNGDVDLGWSIRQSDRDFRGNLVHDPDADTEFEPDASDDADAESGPDTSGDADGGREADSGAGATADAGASAGADDAAATGTASDDEGAATVANGSGAAGAAGAAAGAVAESSADESTAAEVDRVAVDALDDHVGDRIAIEGEVVGVRQTGGPTIFEVRDETGAVDVAAFAGAGERAHPAVEADDVVRVVGEVELRRDEIQVERESLTALDGDRAAAVRDRMTDALDDRAEPDAEALLADHDAVAAVEDDLVAAATAIRRAVLDSRPVLLRHTATADGYVAGAAVERAVLPLVRDVHSRSDAEYHYFDRKPLEGPVYEMDDATADVSNMLEANERHDEPLPLVVLVGAGSTAESVDGLDLLSVYGVETLVVDADDGDEAVLEAADTVVNPSLAGADDAALTTTSLAANLAAHVNADVRGDLEHLPAVSYWESAPEAYVDLAAESGYDETAVRELREALALAAYYQTYEDKRQLVTDLLFGGAPTEGDARGLAAHVSEQFREKVDAALEPAQANAEVREAGGIRFTVLDAESFTDQYEFPPTPLLADELHRREHDAAERQVTLVITADELHVRSDESLDLRAVAEDAAGRVEDAGIRAVGGRAGRIEFVAGEREAVLKAAVQAVASHL